MVYKALLWAEVVGLSYIKWYKFCNNVGRFREGIRGTLKRKNSKHEDWAEAQLLTLPVLIFLFTLPRCQVIFQWKPTKEKLENAKSAKEFSRGFLQNIFSNK